MLRITLPVEEAPLLKLQVNFLGIVDFEKKQLSFDASLYDSHVLFMTLTGDMAVRVYWGDDANFLLSVGGFHPSYRPPPAMGLGDLARLAIIISQPQPLIRAEVYFAVTSNTVQFGAKVELMAGASIFNVYGFLALDALIQFDPFQFVVEIAGMLAVRSGSSVLFAIRLQLTLVGSLAMARQGQGLVRDRLHLHDHHHRAFRHHGRRGAPDVAAADRRDRRARPGAQRRRCLARRCRPTSIRRR